MVDISSGTALMVSLLSLLPKDIVWLIDGILHRHRLDMVIFEYRTMLRVDHEDGTRFITYRGLSYNYRSFSDDDDWSDDDPVYDMQGQEVALLPKNYYHNTMSTESSDVVPIA